MFCSAPEEVIGGVVTDLGNTERTVLGSDCGVSRGCPGHPEGSPTEAKRYRNGVWDPILSTPALFLLCCELEASLGPPGLTLCLQTVGDLGLSSSSLVGLGISQCSGHSQGQREIDHELVKS